MDCKSAKDEFQTHVAVNCLGECEGMVQTNGNERLTAFVSTVVAVAILAAGVTAHQSAAPKVTDVVQVASDLRFQLEMAFRHDIRERETRLAQLDAVMAAWNIAPQDDADRELLLVWLRAAGANSLPGVMQALPPVPEFSSSQLVRAENAPPAEHQVRKVLTPEVKQPAVRQDAQTEYAATAPALSSHSAHKPALVTPTPIDPLEEEMIALRQPESLVSGSRGSEPRQHAVAPRPGNGEQPQVGEQNLLASVLVTNDSAVDAPVRVNLTELAARIAGYQDCLDEVELALLRLDVPDLEVLKQQVEKLDSMTQDYGFVRLYYDSLTPRERQSILEPRSMQATLKEVRRQLKRCEEVRDGDYLKTLDADSEQEFADLRSKIAEIERRSER
jgi:hypothetical protein